MRNVLQVMDYAASYRGNFIESLDCLDRKLKETGARLIYVFPPRARTNAAAHWISKMAESGSITYFLTGTISNDIRMLRHMIREHRIRIVHTHFQNWRTDFAVYFASIGANVQLVRHVHNHYPEETTLQGLLKKSLLELILRRSVFIGVSSSVCDGIRRVFPKHRCHAIDNAIQFNRLDDSVELNRSNYGIPERSVVCFMMGFDFWRKGVDLVLDAVIALRESTDVRLIIAGSSNLDKVHGIIRNQLRERPDWVIAVPPRNDVASYYRMADIFISASREEGFCYAVVEAAYCERMIVASRIPAQGDLQIPYVFWFEPGNARDLKAKLRDALDCKGRYAPQLRAAKSAAERTYSIQNWTTKIIDIYEDS
jgi:glycosyltransferase involved in cell wall biosynthesis